MKILLAPDKFKGNLNSFEICEALTKGIRQEYPQATILSLPMADGGDGFASIVQHYMHTVSVNVSAVNALQEPIESSYQWDADQKTAIIELASASGIALLKQEELNPFKTNTYGTGVLIKHAIETGAQYIILGIGGSATNDGGVGILSALGFSFLNANGEQLDPVGENLISIAKIIAPPELPLIKFQIAVDVTNPLYGTNGASFIYGPQKGADINMLKPLDDGLRNFAAIILQQTGRDVSSPGFGAAGGAACGLTAFFDCSLKPGVEIIIAISGLNEKLVGADYIITGEGAIDDQSFNGKVVGNIAALAKQHQVSCVAVCGRSSLSKDELKSVGIESLLSLSALADNVEDSFLKASALLENNIAVHIQTQK